MVSENRMTNDTAETTPRDEMGDEFVQALTTSAEAIRTARVIRIDDEVAWLDIGSKFESVLPLSDWQDADAPPRVGDEIPVSIEDDLAVEDRPLKIARVTIHTTPRGPGWKLVANARPGDIHSGRVVRRIKGGFLVNIGVNVFLPDEHVPPAVLADPEAFIGQAGNWRILRVDVKRLSIQIAPAW